MKARLPGALLGAALAALPAAAMAQDVGPIIIVTANRMPVPMDRIGQSVTLLDERAILSSQSVGIAELLVQTPGVEYSRNGGPGSTTSVYIRGAETGQTMVLYDGVRLHDPSTTDGGASLADITAGDIGRIEVLRGAQSALYGSHAIGGVINIISRTPVQPLEARVQVEGGGLDTYLARASISGRDGGLIWRVGGSYSATDGVSAYASGAEPDGYDNITMGGQISQQVTDRVSVDLRSLYTRGSADYDGWSQDAPYRAVTGSWLNYAGLNVRLWGALDNRIAFARTDIARTLYDDGAASAAQPVTFDAAGTINRIEYQGTLAIAPGYAAVFGAEYARNSMRTAAPMPPSMALATTRASDTTTGLFGQLSGEVLRGLTLTGGLRHEDHSAFGGHTVGSASAAWSPNGGDTVLRAAFAQGFKAPSLYQLTSEYGNSALAPERASSWDAGIEQRLPGRITLSAIWFQRDTDNLITFIDCPATPADPLCDDGRYGFYANVGKVAARGVELGAAITSGNFSATANYTWLDAVNITAGDANEGRRLARRPQHTFNAVANYLFANGLDLGSSLRIVGKGFNDAGNTQVIAGYALVDLRVSYPVSDSVDIYARIENVTDKRYETVTDYGTLPRVFHAGARARF